MSDVQIDEINENEPSREQVEFYKKQFIKLGFFAAILVVLFGILLTTGLFSRKNYVNGMKKQINKVLSLNDIELVADKNIKVNSLFSTNCSIFTVEGDKTKFVLILKVTTVYGAIPCVFIYDSETESSDFIDFIGVSKKAGPHIKESAGTSQISYWKNRIPGFMKKVLYGGNSK